MEVSGVALPLRLASEPYAKDCISPSCVSLGIPAFGHGNITGSGSSEGLPLLELSALADDDGIRAFGLSRWVSSRKIVLEHLEGAVRSARQRGGIATVSTEDPSMVQSIVPNAWKTEPLFVLVRSFPSSNSMKWCFFPSGEDRAREVAGGDAERARDIVREHFRKKPFQRLGSDDHNDASFVAELIVHSIRHYYSQQILEPSVKGFLGVLEKQFARSDLYLFELLQNAVDDGASVVRFRVIDSQSRSHSHSQSLLVAHNGRSFTPLDVLGLSSVGLSTKSRQGKRTIGFMGVGFKAVYKRYSKVVIDDGTYRFAYEEPLPSGRHHHGSSSNSSGYGWVMLPRWQVRPLDGDGDNHRGWCRFSLERPRGGRGKILKDLSVLPPTAPPLLGRASLVKAQVETKSNDNDNIIGNNDPPSWVLDWNGARHTVRRSNILRYDRSNASELLSVEIEDENENKHGGTRSTQTQTWLFVSHSYVPSESAAATYQTHTKRDHTGSEECCGFVKLGEGNVPLVTRSMRSVSKNRRRTFSDRESPASRESSAATAKTKTTTTTATSALVDGLVHSVLPTTIRMPFPMHLQGSWLLSVDRQQVQDLTDNAWNGDILKHTPELVATFFRWAAHEKAEVAAGCVYQALCALLPPATKLVIKHHKPMAATLLGQSVSLEPLERAFRSERILPVGMSPPKTQLSSASAMDIDDHSSGKPQNSTGDPGLAAIPAAPPELTTAYYEGEKTIWVPPSWFRFLPADFLRGWLGKRPLRTDLLGDAGAYHPLFASESVIGQLQSEPTSGWTPLLLRRVQQLLDELGLRKRRNANPGAPLPEEATEMVIRLMAAIASAYDEHPDMADENPPSPNHGHKKQASGVGNKPNGHHPKNTASEAGEKPTQHSAPRMPKTVNDWPIFVTCDGNLARLEDIVLPSPEFSILAPELASLLRPHMGKDLPDKKPSLGGNGGKKQRKGSTSQGNNKRSTKSSTKTIARLHGSLEAAISRVDCETAGIWSPDGPRCSFDHHKTVENHSDYWKEVLGQASSFLANARALMPSNVVSVAEAALNFLKSCAGCEHLDEDQISRVVQIGRFGLESSDPSFFSYVLVDAASINSAPSSDSSLTPPRLLTKLVAASKAYIGKAVDDNGPGAHLEKFAGSNLQYVSSHYNSVLDATAKGKNKLLQLLAGAGVQTGMSVSISVIDVAKFKWVLGEITPKLPDGKLPSLRKTAPKSNVVLPYGLGVVMNRKNHYLIDSQIPHEWERLVTTMSPSSSLGFLSLLLSMPVEDSKTVSSSTVVAAAKCLTGQGGGDEKHMPVESVRLASETSTPLRRRLFFLPPGQPAARALDVSESRLVKQLQSIKWLPCSVPSAYQEPLSLYSPSEALLERDASRPEMPTVDLPASLLAKLRSSTIAKALTWGTQAPPPPVGELAELVEKAKLLLSSSSETPTEISEVASRMITVWNAICRSYLRDGLNNAEKSKLRVLCTSYCIPVRRVLDSGTSTNWIVDRNRCVRMPGSLPAFEDEKEALKSFTVASLVAANFVCDFNHSIHNPFFHEPDISKALIELSGIQTLDDFARKPLINACASFVRYCCTNEPIVSSRLSAFRDCFSYALKWCLENPRKWPQREDLKVWVRHGPGIGTKTLPARWVPLNNGPVQAVLDDNRARSALLSPEMNIQLLGILDHSDNERDCPNAKLLSAIDRQIIDYFGILRLSDRRFTVKTRARGSPSLIEGASTKLQLVFALLREMDSERHFHHQTNISSRENVYLTNSYDPFMTVRHDSLVREFQAPGMEKPSSIHLYAMFGRSPKLSKNRCILVSGGPEDYSVELEELVLDHVGIRSTSSMVNMKPCRAAVRLLSHIENDTSFMKFVERDFADYEATTTWKALMERKEVLRELAIAENNKDTSALRKLLMRAEELCENDPDGGDEMLKNARNLLPILEREAEERRKREQEKFEQSEKIADCQHDKDLSTELGQGRGKSRTLPAWVTSTSNSVNVDDSNTPGPYGRGRGISNLPAWMTSDSVTGTSESMESTTRNKKSKTDVEELNESKFADADDDREKSVYALGIGRGRGVCNLPAWVTSNKTDNITSTQSNSMSNKAATIDSSLDGLGRGRGVNNLPAWMTSTGAEECLNEAPTSDKHSVVAEQEAKAIVSTIMTENIDNTGNVSSDSKIGELMAVGMGRGRGRGVSNLPAWMTKVQNSSNEGIQSTRTTETTNKRKRSESPVTYLKDCSTSDETHQTKMPRMKEETSKLHLTLNIEMTSSRQTDFCAWLQRTLEQELPNWDGSITSVVRDHDPK